MQVFKRTLYALAALAMIAAAVALFWVELRHTPHASQFSNSDTNKSMFLEQVNSDFRVRSNGDMVVSEVLDYDLGGHWRGLYQDVILAHRERVKNVSVARVDGGQVQPLGPGSGIELGVGGAYGTYGWGVVKDGARKLRIVWNVADTGRHQFRIRYVLAGAVQNHQDASSLLWDVWGTGWETGVGRLRFSFRVPGEIRLFQPRAGSYQSRVGNTSTSGNRAQFTVRDLPEQQRVQVRIAAAPLTAMPRSAGDVLPELKAEVAQLDREYAENAQRSADLRAKQMAWAVIQALIAALLGALLVFLLWRWLGRDDTRPVSAGGSYQYPPEKIPAPVIAQALGGAETDKLVSATLLGFLQRDVFRVLPSVEKKEDVSIRNNVGESRFDGSKVDSYELPIAELLQEAINKHPENSPDFTKLKKYVSASDAESKMKSYTAGIKAEFPKYNLKSTYRGMLRRWLIGLMALGLYLIGMILMAMTTAGDAAARYDEIKYGLWLAAFAPVLLGAAIEGNALYRYRADQADRVRKWETYKDFFARMDMSNQYPLTVEIWDEALLYAAAFGYADKVITNMPRTNADGSPAAYSSDSGMGLVAFNAGSLSAFNSMASGVSGVASMSTSSGSGGGFSGGASGGGGGGGW